MSSSFKIKCCLSSIVQSAILLKPHVIGVQIIQFGSTEIGNHLTKELVFNGYDLTNVIFKEMRTADALGSKSTPISGFFYLSSYPAILMHFLTKFFNFRNTGATVPLRNVRSKILKEWNRCFILWYIREHRLLFC